jgi:hypothetical protein
MASVLISRCVCVMVHVTSFNLLPLSLSLTCVSCARSPVRLPSSCSRPRHANWLSSTTHIHRPWGRASFALPPPGWSASATLSSSEAMEEDELLIVKIQAGN